MGLCPAACPAAVLAAGTASPTTWERWRGCQRRRCPCLADRHLGVALPGPDGLRCPPHWHQDWSTAASPPRAGNQARRWPCLRRQGADVCGPLARGPLHQAAAKLAAEYGSCEEFPRRPAEQGRGGRLACVGWAHLRCAACRAVLRNARSDRPEPKAAGAVPQLRCGERAQRWALPACRLCLYKPCQRANAHAQTAYNRRLAPLVRCSAASPPARQGTYVLLACSAAKVFRAGIVHNPQFGHTAIGQGATVQTLEQYGGESPAFDRGTQQRDAQ